jgi:hypothetical protein
METIQRQMSHLRETFDTSSAPVVDRLMELETRLDEICEALANRQLSAEARSAVEHSCGHILGAIARIEGLARQAVAPAGMWDQIATVRARIERLPTIDNITGLEKRIHKVSGQVGDVVDQSDRSEDMANLERHLSEIGAATRAAVEEIRERPAYDPTDVRALLQRIETWRGEKPASDLPDVERTRETGGQLPAPQETRAAPAGPPVPERQGSNELASPGAGSGNAGGMPHTLDRPSRLAPSEETAAPPAVEPKGPAVKPVPAMQSSPPTDDRAADADTAHRIGGYSTWRKAKVAVVAANTPKY